MYDFRSMIQEMNSGRPFNCVFITFSEQRKQGGEVRRIEAQVIQGDEFAGRPLTVDEQRKVNRTRKRHSRNVRLLVNGHPTEQIRKIYIPLIIEFNGESVTP